MNDNLSTVELFSTHREGYPDTVLGWIKYEDELPRFIGCMSKEKFIELVEVCKGTPTIDSEKVNAWYDDNRKLVSWPELHINPKGHYYIKDDKYIKENNNAGH